MVSRGKKPEAASLAAAIEKARAEYTESLRLRRRLPREFLDGMVKGFGMAVGGTIVFGIIVYFLGRFLVIPQAEQWLTDIKTNASEFQRQFGSPGD